MILLQLGPIELNISVVLSFFAGMMFGFLLLLLLYVYAVIKSIKVKTNFRKAQEEDIDEQEIKWLIEDAQAQFKNKKTRKEEGTIGLTLRLSKELSADIAQKFYPNSKYPYLELTIDETLLLSHYVTNRIDELLSGKIFRLFRKITLRRLMELNDAKVAAEQTKIVKQAKKYKITSVFKHVVTAFQFFNPFHWFKKITVGPAINLIVFKICSSIISITGEETYKIYSKKVFNEDKDIETDMDHLYESLNKEFEEEAKKYEENQDE